MLVANLLSGPFSGLFSVPFFMLLNHPPEIQSCARKLVPGFEKRSAQPQPAQAGHAMPLLNNTVTYLRSTLYDPIITVMTLTPEQNMAGSFI